MSKSSLENRFFSNQLKIKLNSAKIEADFLMYFDLRLRWTFFQSEKTSVQVGAVLTVLLFDLLNRQKNVTNKDQGELLSLQSHYLRCVWFEWSQVTSRIYELSQCRKRLKIPTWFHSQITEELESVKAQMDERGTNMTDAGKFL